MNDAYFCWLIGLIGSDYICRNYQKLLWKLYTTDYIWELDYDKNRAEDGLYLRKIYEREYGFYASGNMNYGPNNWYVRPCSLLEMLVALARKAEDEIMHDPDYGDRSGKWFWEMIENLGLDVYDDFHFYDDEVTRIVNYFLQNQNKNGGIGGFLQVQKQVQNVTKTDLWLQMNVYLLQRYPV